MGKYINTNNLENPLFEKGSSSQRIRRQRERDALYRENDNLRHIAEVSLNLLQKRVDEKILFYLPCCKAHGESCDPKACKDSIHLKFHQDHHPIRIVFGGNRSGKSVSGVTELILRMCFKNHPFTGKENRIPSKNRIFCSDFSVIEKTILPLVYEWIPKSSLCEGENSEAGKMERWSGSYDSRFHILRLKNGSVLDFMSYDQDVSKSESVELDNAWADEEMPERFYSATLARLISRDGHFWMTVTPLSGLSWGLSFLDGTDPRVQTFVFDMRDNPHLSRESIEAFIQSIPEHEKESRIHGRFLELQGMVYKELKRDVHYVENAFPFDSESGISYPVVMAMDPHPRKATVITWAYIDPQDCVFFFDELEMKGTASEIARVIREKEELHKSPTVLRLIDPAARAQGSNIACQTDTLTEFEREGLSFALADNSEAGYNVVHEYLSYDPSREISSLNRPQCYFSRDVPKTWYGMTHLLWDDYRFARSLKDPKESVRDYKKDFPDCVRYTLARRPVYHQNDEPVSIGNTSSDKRRSRPVREFVLGGAL